MSSLGNAWPHLSRVAKIIGQKSVFQKKTVERILSEADEGFLNFADSFIARLNNAVQAGDDNYQFLVESYLDYTKSIRIEEMYFAKEGKYRKDNFEDVYKEVYGRDDYMLFYVTGLGMTQIFWPNHYRIVCYFVENFLPLVNHARKGAEVGVGHGLFHSELLRASPQLNTNMLDISSVALAFTSRMIEAAELNPERATALQGDVQENIPFEDKSLEVLLLGELIEHIQHSKRVMTELSGKMKPEGWCFFTTAANAPAEDHILLFKDTGEIRKFIAECGWRVMGEQTGTLKGMSLEEAEKHGHNINYAAILKVA